MEATACTANARTTIEAAPRGELYWLTQRSGYTPLLDARGIRAVCGGRTVGMVVFDGFTETLAQVHLALETPRAAAALLRPTFNYAFRQLGLAVLVTMLDSRNTRAVGLARGLGFREACRIVDGAAVGADLILFEMRRHACRFTREVH